MQLLTYSTPAIVNPNGADTYIFFSVQFNGETHKFKARKGINRIKDKRVKKAECEALRAAREQWLKDGWNPVIDPEFALRKVANRREISGTKYTFAEALAYSLEQRKPTIGTKTHLDYFNMQNIATSYAKKIGIGDLPVTEIRRSDIVELLDHIHKVRKWSNHRYNAYYSCLRAAFSDLTMREIVQQNPCHLVAKKAVAESNKYVPYTTQEKKRMYEFLAENHRPLFRFMLLVYHVGIRPKELTKLQVKDFNLDLQTITIAPDRDKENSKTMSVRIVPINDKLMPFIYEMNLDTFPGDHYVFGTPYQFGQSSHNGMDWMKQYRDKKGKPEGGRGGKRSDYLTPHPFATKRDTVTKLWKELVIDELGISKYLYAAKHTGADDKIIAGIPIEVLQSLYGHANPRMSATYAKALIERNKRAIIDTSPDFI